MFSVVIENMAVRIAPYAGYKNKFTNETGIVERKMFVEAEHCNKIGVRLDNHINPRSSYGVFWFDEDKLEIIENYESEETIR